MASPNISFDTIPSSIRKPGVYAEFNYRLAVRSLPSNKQRMTIIAQRLAAGTAPAGTLVQAFSDDQAAVLFGSGSLAHLMVAAAINANPYADVAVLPLDDAAGSAAATQTTTFAGTVVVAGVVNINCGDQTLQLAVTTGQTAAQVAAAAQLLLAQQVKWPFSFATVGAVITGTAKNKGTVLNNVVFSASTTATGITITTTQPTGGAVDPDLVAPLASIFTSDREFLVTPYNTQTPLTALRNHVTQRSSGIEKRGCYGVFALTSTLSAGTTLAGLINDIRMQMPDLPATVTPDYELAASYAAVAAFEEDPAMPLNTLELLNVAPPPVASRMGRTEQEVMLANGVTPIEVGPGERVQIVRAITTYTLNPQGVPDPSGLDFTTIRTLDYVRKAIVQRLALRFPRNKKSVRTKKAIRTQVVDVLLKCQELDIVQNVEANLDGVIVEDDSQDSTRVDIRIPADVVKGLHVVAARIDLIGI